jgi:hypothetical protein
MNRPRCGDPMQAGTAQVSLDSRTGCLAAFVSFFGYGSLGDDEPWFSEGGRVGEGRGTGSERAGGVPLPAL